MANIHADWKAFDKTQEEVEKDIPSKLWSIEKNDNGSDWKIIVSLRDDSSPAVTYYVHKLLLGYGPCRSLYFRRLFDNLSNDVGLLTQESNSSTTVLEFENKSSIEAFPYFIDFIYYLKNSTYATYPVVMRYFSNYFVNEALFHDTNKCIEENVKKNGNAIQLMDEAFQYRDEKLVQILSKWSASYIKHDVTRRKLGIAFDSVGPNLPNIISQIVDDCDEAIGCKHNICFEIVRK